LILLFTLCTINTHFGVYQGLESSMQPLAERDLTSVLAFLKANYATRDLASYRSQVISTLPKLIPADVAAYNEVDTHQQLTDSRFEPRGSVGADSVRVFNRYAHEHPVISHIARTGDSRVLKISDFLSRARFHRLGLYNEFFRGLGLEYQMAATIPARRRIIGIVLNRSGQDFNERERLMLSLISPHLSQAYYNAAAMTTITEELKATKRALEELGSAAIVLGPGGRVTSMTASARKLLADYFDSPRGGDGLPDMVRQWCKAQRSALAQLQVPERLVVNKAGKRLVARMVPEGHQTLLLLSEEATVVGAQPLGPLSLTTREAEVLAWVAKGRTNSEIGSILNISSRTIQKHLEHIFQKLGVESRTAAAGRFWEASHQRPQP
jgi:DNA-binding CsgD family transcriptional regulator